MTGIINHDLLNNAKSIFFGYLRKSKMKITRERELILEEVLKAEAHFEVEEILISLRNNNIRVSRGSIYRTIPLLVNCGILRAVIFTDKHQHYEVMLLKGCHAHLICEKCGKIIEFGIDDFLNGIDTICVDNHFKKSSLKLEINGICEDCS